MQLLINFIDLFVESAPWLLLGFTVAGLMKALVPQDLLARQLGEPGFASTVKAALIGAPLPLCSCGVIPAALGLRKAGASKAATTSFLISTPETGVDSISISYALLGPVMAVIRPIAAIVSAVCAGLMVGSDAARHRAGNSAKNHGESSQLENTHEADSCCATKTSQPSIKVDPAPGLIEKLQAGLRFTFINLVRDIALWLFVGLLMAALVKTYVPEEFLTQWGGGLLAFIVMALIGVPMYICATASTPIAAGLLFAGVSPGAVLVFLLVGPATNIATVGLVAKELGARALWSYLAAVVGVSFVFGYALNWATSYWQLDFAVQAEHAHQLVTPWLGNMAAVLLAALLLPHLFNALFGRLFTSEHAH